MHSVKKFDILGNEEIIAFDRAVAEIVDAIKTQTKEMLLQLHDGQIVHINESYYMEINPVKDTLKNIDDEIDLDKED